MVIMGLKQKSEKIAITEYMGEMGAQFSSEWFRLRAYKS
jgi:hypothetical protein